jgi:hypothetical protein
MMWLSGIGFLYCDLGEKFETPYYESWYFIFHLTYRPGPLDARGLGGLDRPT